MHDACQADGDACKDDPHTCMYTPQHSHTRMYIPHMYMPQQLPRMYLVCTYLNNYIPQQLHTLHTADELHTLYIPQQLHTLHTADPDSTDNFPSFFQSSKLRS